MTSFPLRRLIISRTRKCCALVIGWRKQCKMCQVYLNARQNVFQVFLKGRLNMPVRRDLSMQQSYVLSLAWYEVRFY